jgi:hypothetical protein
LPGIRRGRLASGQYVEEIVVGEWDVVSPFIPLRESQLADDPSPASLSVHQSNWMSAST